MQNEETEINGTEQTHEIIEIADIEAPEKNKLPPRPRKGKKKNEVDEVTVSALQTIEQHFKNKKPEDEDDIFGKNIANKMRKIENEDQKMLAEKLIQEVICSAHFGKLGPNSSIRDECNSLRDQEQHRIDLINY